MSGIRFGRGQEYVFFRREEVKGQWDLPGAIRFLDRFRSDPHAMSAFRRQLSSGTAVGGPALTDDLVIARYARLLVSGEVVVAYPARERWIGHLSVVRPPEAASAPAPAPATAREEVEDPPTFEEEHDGVAQAATLIAAARDGAPFCEECARRAAALAAPHARPVGQQTYWVEIALIGEDDKPVPEEEYLILLPDGSRRQGFLDGNGVARITEIPQNGQCKVSFPNLDRDAWQFVKTMGDTAPSA